MHAVIRNYLKCLYLSFSFPSYVHKAVTDLISKYALAILTCQDWNVNVWPFSWRDPGVRRDGCYWFRQGLEIPQKNVHEILRNHNFARLVQPMSFQGFQVFISGRLVGKFILVFDYGRFGIECRYVFFLSEDFKRCSYSQCWDRRETVWHPRIETSACLWVGASHCLLATISWFWQQIPQSLGFTVIVATVG